MNLEFEDLVYKILNPNIDLERKRPYLKELIDDYYENVNEVKRFRIELGYKLINCRERRELSLTFVPDLDEFRGFSDDRFKSRGKSYTIDELLNTFNYSNRKELDWIYQGFKNEIETNLSEIKNVVDCLAYLKRLEQKYSNSFHQRENHLELTMILRLSVRQFSNKKNINDEQIRMDIDILEFIDDVSIYIESAIATYINIYTNVIKIKTSEKADSKNSNDSNELVSKTPLPKQKKFLKLYLEELKKGTQKTDAILDTYSKAGYKDSRQMWKIIDDVEKGRLIYKELTDFLKLE